MAKKFKVKVFGKPGCAKCKTLNQRLDKLFENEAWAEFEKEYCDLETIDGLVQFSESECINPQRIPAMLVTRLNEGANRYDVIPNAQSETKDEVLGNSALCQHIGLQTDYTAAGKGVISPKMIQATLERAQNA